MSDYEKIRVSKLSFSLYTAMVEVPRTKNNVAYVHTDRSDTQETPGLSVEKVETEVQGLRIIRQTLS